MKHERKTKFGEGIVFALVVLVCVAVLITAGIRRNPKVETAYPIHVLPESFVDLDKTDINTAPAEELDELPGVGETLAQNIIAYREANGGFESIEEIMLVDGIGESLFAGMRDMITAG